MRGVLLTAIIAVGSFAVSAQEPAPPARDFKTYQPHMPAARIDTSEAPVIDGDLSDAAWAKAHVIDELYQLEPVQGVPGTERTIFRVMYDANFLYVSAYCYDSDPSEIRATIKARDGDIYRNDFIRIYIDPGLTRRDAYAFEINPLGARLDALIENNANYRQDWDTIWHAHSRLVADGWVTEVAIPFRSLSYEPDKADWGFDLYRFIRRKTERIRWSAIDKTLQPGDVSRAGTIEGIRDLETGLGLEIQAYATGIAKREWRAPRETDLTLQPSANLYYKITPALTGTLTFNTDFSDTPLDERRVNTGRFALFYPETRDFFLQDAAIFEFGGTPLFDDPNGSPFFTRNIGLVSGVPVDIVAGGKLSGALDGLGIGMLTVQSAGTDTTNGQLLSVGRFTMPVLGQSKLGLLFTNGDPTGSRNNTVAGADFQFRDTEILGGDTIQADFFYEHSFTSAAPDDDAYGFEVSFPNEPWYGELRFREIGGDFDPALGFVNRTGIRDYYGNVVHRHRYDSSWLRWTELATWMSATTDLDDRIESRQNGAWAGMFTNDSDSLFVNVMNNYERVLTPFELPRGVIVPADEYEWTNVSIDFGASDARWISGGVTLECCTYLDGAYRRADFRIDMRPSETFGITANYFYSTFDMPGGEFDVAISALDLTVNFTPDMSLRTQVQYDNISESMGLSARYRWEFNPGSELFFAIGESADVVGDHYASNTTQFSVRIGHTHRL